jgi:UDP-3-O-[3-hydroxymyristoyl] glucosamine N-acyltransferase
VRIGPNCLLVAQAGIAGSTTLGSGVTVAGQSGAAGHLELGDGCIVAAKSAVFEDIPEGSFVAGVPARDHRTWKRSQALQRRLPEMRSELLALRSRIEALESKTKGKGEED